MLWLSLLLCSPDAGATEMSDGQIRRAQKRCEKKRDPAACVPIAQMDLDAGNLVKAARWGRLGCDAGEMRGCRLLALANEERHGDDLSVTQARTLYDLHGKACEGQDALACGEWSRIVSEWGNRLGLSIDAVGAAHQAGCDAGNDDACTRAAPWQSVAAAELAGVDLQTDAMAPLHGYIYEVEPHLRRCAEDARLPDATPLTARFVAAPEVKDWLVSIEGEGTGSDPLDACVLEVIGDRYRLPLPLEAGPVRYPLTLRVDERFRSGVEPTVVFNERRCDGGDPAACDNLRELAVAIADPERRTQLEELACRDDPERCEPGEEEPVISAGLEREQLDEVLRRYLGRLTQCYERGLDENPYLGGKLVIEFTIEPDGRVEAASHANSTLNDPPVEQCVVGWFADMEFPSPEGGEAVQVAYPLTFTPRRSQ